MSLERSFDEDDAVFFRTEENTFVPASCYEHAKVRYGAAHAARAPASARVRMIGTDVAAGAAGHAAWRLHATAGTSRLTGSPAFAPQTPQRRSRALQPLSANTLASSGPRGACSGRRRELVIPTYPPQQPSARPRADPRAPCR